MGCFFSLTKGPHPSLPVLSTETIVKPGLIRIAGTDHISLSKPESSDSLAYKCTLAFLLARIDEAKARLASYEQPMKVDTSDVEALGLA